jgi:putative ABC transport system substrate-binding protein
VWQQTRACAPRGVPCLKRELQLKRRDALLFASALVAAPAVALAQAPRTRRLGVLATTDEKTVGPFFLDAFRAGMLDLGYRVDRDYVLDIRYARGDMSRLPALADELLALKPDVLMGIEPAVHVLVKKTATVPIVLVSSSDPVASGLVRSFARPGTNVTGMAHLYTELVAKQIELLAELVPSMSRVAYLGDSSAPLVNQELGKKATRYAAAAKKLVLVDAWVHDAKGIAAAFARFESERSEGVVIASSGTMVAFRSDIMKETKRLRLPAVYAQSEVPRLGGLVSYGADLGASYRKDVPRFVDLILKGANPAEVPVQRTTKYELVINLNAAREIGLQVPRSLLLRADRVIE